MNNYESVLILNGNLNKKEIQTTLKEFSNFINKYGKVSNVDEIGLKKLAYEINKHKEGYYVVILFELESENIGQLERLYKYSENVLKFLTVKQEY